MDKQFGLKEIFSFCERDITSYMLYDMRLGSKFKKSFNYILSKLPAEEMKHDLSDLKWDEGKNYDWAAISEGNLTLLFRKYCSHFTVYFRNREKVKVNDTELPDEFTDEYYSEWGCFTFSSDEEKRENSDEIVEDYFLNINKYIKPIIEHIQQGKVFLLWNSVSIPRDKWIDIKNVWNGSSDDISSINSFIFCCEELFSKHLELFSQNEMVEKVKTIKEGDMLSTYVVTNVKTGLKDEYYHDIGISIKNTNFPDSKESWADVYSLTRYYLNVIFPDL